ncbi:hypothetical protein [Dyadobacter pollutisoli]|jgi:hypothetical protein|uniref:Uncharacterized protein n=1 Tax=Dyadobacter pollutisoli TaxID=2910158 RepID=A0A9E8N9L6_9BACT|nr:hypothetical protein [Dyadobacter pollutisoli]WAC12505.1 hypothetical protein ON006_00795 [Dyadobacter pollutisoli]
MIRNFSFYLLLLAVGLFTSCDDKVDVRSKTFCVQVEYVREYHCTSSEPVHVVEFLSPNSLATKITHINASVAKYQAAMLDLPDSVLVTGKNFYMQFHRDANREKKAALGYCTMEYLPVNILVCEAISKSCL